MLNNIKTNVSKTKKDIIQRCRNTIMKGSDDMQKHSFLKKDILRAFRDINACMDDLLENTGRTMFLTNIKRFIMLIETNGVLKYLLEPFWKLDISKVEVDDCGWIDLNIPVEIDYQIAYVLKKYKDFSKEDNKFCIHSFLFVIYKNKLSDENSSEWNQSIVAPCFREILFRLNDMIEDLPDEEEISEKYMNIFNVGTINNSNGNIGIGENITQSNNSEDIFKDIIELINKNIPNEEREEILKAVEEMKSCKGNSTFKDKVTNFISSTAKYSTIFIGMWEQLQKII